MTVFDTIRDFLMTQLNRLDIGVVRFAVQAALFAVCPTIACALAYMRNVRIVAVQVSLCVISWIALLCLPIDKVEIYNPTARLFVLTVCILTIVCTPRILGFLLAPTPTVSRRITRGIYAAIIVLTICQLLAGGTGK